MKKVVVTGATGAIGRALIDICIKKGYFVLAIVHRSSQRAEELNRIDNVIVLKLDMDEYDCAIDKMISSGIDHSCYEFFFHLAWNSSFGKDRDNLDIQLDNVRYTLSAARLAKALGCSSFIGTGSQAEYGGVEGLLSPDTPTFPESGYGIAKSSAGQMSRLLCSQIGLKHMWCRVLSVYGPYDREQTLISTAVRAMMADEETEFTLCNQMWDYIYSGDAARALLLVAEKGISGKVYIVGSGEVHPLREYIEKIAKLTGYRRTIGFGKRPYNDKQVMYLQADMQSLNELGYVPEVSFEEGIRRIIQWKAKG